MAKPIRPKLLESQDGKADAPSKRQGVQGRKPDVTKRYRVAKRVFRKLSAGKSLREACKLFGIRPATLLDWVREDSVLASQYTHAREAQAHHLAERAIAVSRRAKLARDTVGVQAARLEVDTLKWYVGKMFKDQFGDSVTVHDDGVKTVRVVFEEPQPSAVRARLTEDADVVAIEG